MSHQDSSDAVIRERRHVAGGSGPLTVSEASHGGAASPARSGLTGHAGAASGHRLACWWEGRQ